MNRIIVRVRAGAKTERIVQQDDGTLKAWVSPPPEHERANTRLISLLADFLDVPKRTIHITAGQHAVAKIIEIHDEPNR